VQIQRVIPVAMHKAVRYSPKKASFLGKESTIGFYSRDRVLPRIRIDLRKCVRLLLGDQGALLEAHTEHHLLLHTNADWDCRYSTNPFTRPNFRILSLSADGFGTPAHSPQLTAERRFRDTFPTNSPTVPAKSMAFGTAKGPWMPPSPTCETTP
jgi:hypothetical protein